MAPIVGRSIVSMISSDVDPMFVDLSIDWRVLTFTAAITIMTCVLFGMAPAFRATRLALEDVLRGSARSLAGGRSRSTLRRALVVVQVALSVVLLVGGLLFARSLFNLLTVDAGFRPDGILEADVDLRRLHLAGTERREAYRRLLERIQATPGVSGAAATMTVPLVTDWSQMVYIDGDSPKPRGIANFNGVSHGYFATLATTLRAGRDFTEDDTPESPPVAIVNEAFGERFFARASPIGRSFQLDGPNGRPGPRYTIVGLVANTKYNSLREPFQPIVYLAFNQHPAPPEFGQILIRSSLSVRDAIAAVRPAIADLDPRIAFHFHDYQEQIRYALLQDRLMALLCGFFAVVAALVATIGVYGVIGYSTAQRSNEIGIRLALGAEPHQIVSLVLREAAMLLTAGLAAGCVLAFVVSQATRTLLFGLEPDDPRTFAVAAITLACAVGFASYLPARRASNTDPVTALRAE